MSSNLYQEQQDIQKGLDLKNADSDKADAEKADVKGKEAKGLSLETKLEEAVDKTNSLASRAKAWLTKATEAKQRFLNSETKNSSIDVSDTVRHVRQLLVFLLAIVVAFNIDKYFFGAFTEYLLGLLGQGQEVLETARWVVPLVVIALEVLVSVQIYTHRAARNWISLAAVSVLGVTMILGFSAVTTATFLEAQGAEAVWDLSFIQMLLSAPMLFVSICVHSLIVFSGKLGHEAEGYLILLTLRLHVRFRERLEDFMALKTVKEYLSCKRLERRYRRLYDEDFRLTAEDFSEETREVVNTKMGRELIPEPAPASSRGNGTARSFRDEMERQRREGGHD